MGAQATERFKALARRYDVIGDVRGPGLFIGVDFVENQETKTPATAACAKAWEFAIERGLITQFGGFGANVLKFKPPLMTPQEDFDRMLDIFGRSSGIHSETSRTTAPNRQRGGSGGRLTELTRRLYLHSAWPG